jgi:hypothetical protein
VNEVLAPFIALQEGKPGGGEGALSEAVTYRCFERFIHLFLRNMFADKVSGSVCASSGSSTYSCGTCSLIRWVCGRGYGVPGVCVKCCMKPSVSEAVTYQCFERFIHLFLRNMFADRVAVRFFRTIHPPVFAEHVRR